MEKFCQRLQERSEFIAKNQDKLKSLFDTADVVGKEAASQKVYKPVAIFEQFNTSERAKWRTMMDCGCI
jgi:hypothetical protein